MSDIIEIVESLEKSSLLIDGGTETVKTEIKKKQEGGFLRAMIKTMAASLIQPVASSLINSITGKGQERGFLPLLALSLMIKVLEKGVRRAGRRYNNMDHIDGNFYFRSILVIS